jgi:hypothetical protein
MNRRAIRYLTIGSIAVGLGIAGTLVASAQWSIPGQGAVQITTATMPAGSTPTAKKQGDIITVSWDDQEIVPGVKMQKYLVTAHDTQTSPHPDVTRTVSATKAGTQTTTFTQAELGNGKWIWGITAKYQLWSGAEGPRSAPAVPIGGKPAPALLAAVAPAAVSPSESVTVKPTLATDVAPPAVTAAPPTAPEKPKADPTTSAPQKTVEPEKTETQPAEPSPSSADPTPAESAP